MDRKKMTDGIRTFLEGLDERFEGDDQEKTPDRVVASWIEDLVAGYAIEPEGELSWTSAPKGCGRSETRAATSSSNPGKRPSCTACPKKRRVPAACHRSSPWGDSSKPSRPGCATRVGPVTHTRS